MIIRRFVSMACILSIALWLTCVVTTGVAAANTFSVLLKMNPIIPEYEAYDLARHGRLLAGLTVEPIFRMTDLIQMFLVPATLLLVVMQNTLIKPPTVLRWINIGTVVIAIVLVLGRWTVIDPPMDTHLQSYREAARIGDMQTANKEQESFNDWHRIAEPLWGATGLVLLIGLASVGASIPSDRRHAR